MSQVKLVTLDVTNTVMRVLGGVGHQYSSIAKIHGIELDPDVINQAFRTKFKEQNKQFPIFGSKSGLTSRQWWDTLVQKTLTQSGMDSKDNKLSKISQDICTHFETEGWMLIPDSVHVLQELKNRNFKVGAISNFDDTLENVLRRMSILHYFDFVLSAWTVGHAKPDPEIYLKALNIAKTAASESIHVGDDYQNDYLGPKKVGMQSILFCPDVSNIPTGVKCSIANLSDLLKYV
ncbi:haloacid dehalogenase-like hydrolase domain-containing protein 3 [Saccostrea echinata]|uniref:haloacid dehalogenase-like hydrolase domain-containing protein 3 n=1 Tax=Saccostrea echinata TaxID=191078 RepID=UPI002A83D75C|nr:haloacid dehalogenase-like hydrolase domain-containing protein 3 [Saccostrea echinata]